MRIFYALIPLTALGAISCNDATEPDNAGTGGQMASSNGGTGGVGDADHLPAPGTGPCSLNEVTRPCSAEHPCTFPTIDCEAACRNMQTICETSEDCSVFDCAAVKGAGCKGGCGTAMNYPCPNVAYGCVQKSETCADLKACIRGNDGWY